MGRGGLLVNYINFQMANRGEVSFRSDRDYFKDMKFCENYLGLKVIFIG